MANISESSKALSSWAAKFLSENSPKPKRRTRRLSLAEAEQAAKVERIRKMVYGHYQKL
uniref:Uncharacterized protein n=1 Tax=viral metagenome TaxID=1070528 RepID=A0A6M3KLU6_9ZZZZ